MWRKGRTPTKFLRRNERQSWSLRPGLYQSGAELYGCQLAMDMFKLKREDLVPQVKDVISAMDFIDKSEGAQVIFI